jgi:hypothetical protein
VGEEVNEGSKVRYSTKCGKRPAGTNTRDFVLWNTIGSSYHFLVFAASVVGSSSVKSQVDDS